MSIEKYGVRTTFDFNLTDTMDTINASGDPAAGFSGHSYKNPSVAPLPQSVRSYMSHTPWQRMRHTVCVSLASQMHPYPHLRADISKAP